MRKYFLISDSVVFLSKFLHVIRDMLIAVVLGTSQFADAFFGISRLLSLITSLFANGIFSALFSPIFLQLLREGRNSALQFSHEIQLILAFIGIVIFTVAEIFTEKILFCLMPGMLSSPVRDSLITTAKIAFPSILFIPLTSLYYSMVHTRRNFALITPYTIITNTALTAVILFTGNNSTLLLPNMGCTIAFSGMIQMLLFLHQLEKSDLIPVLIQFSLSKNIKNFFKCFLPSALASEAYQINILVSIYFASKIPQAISSLCYAEGIIQLFFVLTNTSLLEISGSSSIMFTHNAEELKKTQNKALKKVITACIPVTIMLIFMPEHITASLFLLGGKFDIQSVKHTTHMLEILAFALPAHALKKGFLQPFLAFDKLKAPVSFTVASVVLNAITSIILVPHYSYTGIAIALCAAAWLDTLLIIVYLKRRKMFSSDGKIPRLLSTVFFPASITIFFIQICEAFIESHPGISTIYSLRLASLVIVCISSIFIYYFLLSQLKKIPWKKK
ncbi:murein biosynthesis integral membrane protein MurJ [Neorickettsia sennetsu]|uniref:Membrane protein, MviN family n=1 Tax=Ehrlichia sennetsu (strain ATCC VR-367 / Miyayama) TaxID=222891 RepID=Q2GDK3_EHRS3|nr:lipid II flippase MurJ [Neorickettsia sennetsu]ABD46164.1 membrane protein, MviN family [Neorickettsia sennetsu str. Miyayama]